MTHSNSSDSTNTDPTVRKDSLPAAETDSGASSSNNSSTHSSPSGSPALKPQSTAAFSTPTKAVSLASAATNASPSTASTAPVSPASSNLSSPSSAAALSRLSANSSALRSPRAHLKEIEAQPSSVSYFDHAMVPAQQQQPSMRRERPKPSERRRTGRRPHCWHSTTPPKL